MIDGDDTSSTILDTAKYFALVKAVIAHYLYNNIYFNLLPTDGRISKRVHMNRKRTYFPHDCSSICANVRRWALYLVLRNQHCITADTDDGEMRSEKAGS